jgi:hypothetical protein
MMAEIALQVALDLLLGSAMVGITARIFYCLGYKAGFSDGTRRAMRWRVLKSFESN